MSFPSLPAELLLIIFRNVFTSQYSLCQSSSKCHTCLRVGPKHVAWGPTQSFNTSDPTLFPFALAGVLPRWRDILSTVPEYWTRPVFYLDGTITDIDVADVLRFSRDLSLEVYVTRRVFPLGDDVAVQVEEDAREEARRMREVMDALKPHLPRCQHIFIHTFRSSSLPSLRHDFSRHCPFLAQFKLECDVDDGLNVFSHSQPLPFEQFTCPALHTLHVDGPNFREIVMKRHETWWKNAFKSTRTLHIQSLTATSGPLLRCVQALECISLPVLPNLSTLVLSNVVFDQNTGSDTPENPPPPLTLTLNLLILSSMSFSCIFHLFQHVFLGDLYNIRLESCGNEAEDSTIDPIYTYFPATFSLTLNNLSPSRHLTKILQIWNGQRLFFISCPGFNDSVLEMMRKPLDSTTAPELFGCPHLAVVSLQDCTNFTPSALITMVNARNSGIGPHADDVAAGGVNTAGAIYSISVYGDAPRLTDAERQDLKTSEIIHWTSGLKDEE